MHALRGKNRGKTGEVPNSRVYSVTDNNNFVGRT